MEYSKGKPNIIERRQHLKHFINKKKFILSVRQRSEVLKQQQTDEKKKFE